MSDRQLPAPVWERPLEPQTYPQRQLALAATQAWACAVVHFTGESASALSKRFSPPSGSPGSNSKYFYGLLHGKHVLLPGGRGRYGYDLLADVDRHKLGRHATRHYYQPWELLYPDITLERVCETLHTLSPRITQLFFHESLSGVHPAWLRRRTNSSEEFEMLVQSLVSTITTVDEPFAEDRWFDVFIALWCLLREAGLRKDMGRVVFYRKIITQIHEQISAHPVFANVFDTYQALVRVIESREIAFLSGAQITSKPGELLLQGHPTRRVYFGNEDCIVRIEQCGQKTKA